MGIFNQKTSDGINIIRVQGKLLGGTLRDLSETFEELMAADANQVILNFQNVNIIDSHAVGFLVKIFNEFTKKGAHLKLCNVGTSVRNLFKLADLEELFEIYESEHDAIANINSSPKPN